MFYVFTSLKVALKVLKVSLVLFSPGSHCLNEFSSERSGPQPFSQRRFLPFQGYVRLDYYFLFKFLKQAERQAEKSDDNLKNPQN